MHEYAVFGGRLRSALPFPELLEVRRNGRCDWHLELRESVPAVAGATLLGEIPIANGVRVRLYRHAEGFRLQYEDTGTFDVSADGTSLWWTPTPEACTASARLDVIGFVLALALHAKDVFTLHGSAVATAEGVAAFIAPRFHGKSTLASALVAAGARLVTDDSLAVSEEAAAVLASPGIQSIRLWQDSIEHLRTDPAREVGSLNGKRAFQLDGGRVLRRSAPLEAVYLLRPVVSSSARQAARRARLEPGRSALVIAGHAKLAAFLEGTDEAVRLLRHAAGIARKVPVYVLEIARDLDRLGDAVESVLEWHPVSGDREPAAGSPGIGRQPR